MSYRDMLEQLQNDVKDIKKRINKIELRMAFVFGVLFMLNKII